jgi:hypothetical protein
MFIFFAAVDDSCVELAENVRVTLIRREWPCGRAIVVGAPGFPEGKGSGGGRRAVVVDLPLSVLAHGHDRYELRHRARAPAGKLPVRGAVLPVLINPDDPNDLRIDWSRAPTMLEHADRVLARARGR